MTLCFKVDWREGYAARRLTREVTMYDIIAWDFDKEFIRDLRDLNVGEETTYNEMGEYIVFERTA